MRPANKSSAVSEVEKAFQENLQQKVNGLKLDYHPRPHGIDTAEVMGKWQVIIAIVNLSSP